MLLLIIVTLVVLLFVYTNGFHDTANSIAAIVSTRQLSPRQAILLASFTNLLGALCGTAIALTISHGLINDTLIHTCGKHAMSEMLLCALLAAIIWNLGTWWFGMPSSTSHALIGGLCGAALSMTDSFSAIYWQSPSADSQYFWQTSGLLWKVVIPMLISPLLGLTLGWLIMMILYNLLKNKKPARVNGIFSPLQIVSSGYMGFSHGMNDAPMGMGILMLAFAGATHDGIIQQLPEVFQFMRIADTDIYFIPLWIKILCALFIALGTAAGGWKIIRTLGNSMIKLRPINGFAAEATTASILVTSSSLGMPVSSTHIVTAAIVGSGCARNHKGLRRRIIHKILACWLLTLPCSMLMGYLLVKLMNGLELF